MPMLLGTPGVGFQDRKHLVEASPSGRGWRYASLGGGFQDCKVQPLLGMIEPLTFF